jgi:hypothetical protein
VGGNGKKFILVNGPGRPASNDDLIQALLAFASGADVVMVSGLAPAEEAGRRPPTKLRQQFARLLQLAIEDRPQFAAEVELLAIDLVASRSIVGRPVLVYGERGHSIELFLKFSPAVALNYALVLLLDLSKFPHEKRRQPRKRQPKPYLTALSRCQWSDCRRFYIARKQEGGGRENRLFCSTECRRAYHNSAERKKAAKPHARQK